MKVALVRHPRPLVPAGVCYGRLDVGGDEAGLPAIMEQLCDFRGRIWSSPARRCRIVARALEHAWGVRARFDARLQELDFGAWEGMAWDDVPRAALDAWAADLMGFAPPGGESGAALAARVVAFYGDLVTEAEDCVVVSHGGPLRVLQALVGQRPIDLSNPPPPVGSVRISNE